MNLITLRNTSLQHLIPVYGHDEAQALLKVLLQHYLGLNSVAIVMQREMELSDSEITTVTKAVARLQKEEPIQYIIGETEFYGLPFLVSPAVLIPRPETEELVDWIVKSLKSSKFINSEKSPLRILDIGTGSGCIAISLAKAVPQARIAAIDVSVDALKVAKKNAEINKVAVEFIEKDILTTANLTEEFDIIVSNPPYVRVQEKASMQKNVLENEPELALYVTDDDPLVFYKKITALAKEKLSVNGLLFFEINQYLEQEMQLVLENENFQNISVRKDIFGAYRMIRGSKNK